jgi:hypothetical protein
MYGIDRAGQKVICVIDHSLWADFCCDVQSWPLQDEIYTVSGFGEIENEPGVFLYELPCITCACSGLSGSPWPLEIFRPVNTARADIGIFTRLLDRVPVPVGD